MAEETNPSPEKLTDHKSSDGGGGPASPAAVAEGTNLAVPAAPAGKSVATAKEAFMGAVAKIIPIAGAKATWGSGDFGFILNSPSDGEVLPGNAQGYLIQASGVTNGVTSSNGLTGVNWWMDGGVLTPSPASTTDNWKTWSAQIQVPLGIHKLSFGAYSVISTFAEGQTVTVTVTLPAEIFDVEPLSYLGALEDFGTQPFNADGTARVTTDPAKTKSLTLDSIDGGFHQSIVDVLAPRNSMRANEAVHQTRICIEVLRKYLAANPPTATQAQALATAESAYRQAAYFSLLNQIGTSYDEIRLARTHDRNNHDDRKKLQAICDRLGIQLGSTRPDHLDQLFVDPSATGSLTEEFLEQTFGLVDTTRDPFSQGATIGDTLNQITRWNLNGVEWGRNTDPDGIIYLALNQTGPTTGQASLFSDAARTALVATGTLTEYSRSGFAGTLSPSNDSGLSGSLDVGRYLNLRTIDLSVFPRFLSWQFQRLRNTWLAQDFTPDTVLTFQFTATDSLGATASATVDVNVSHINRPLASAGPNRTVKPGTAVTLTGSASSPGFTIGAYQWVQVAGPPVTLSNAGTATASFTAPAVATDTVLAFQLTVTDSGGATAVATANVTVYHIEHTVTVNAGASQAVSERSTVMLTGSATDSTPGVKISAYQWTQIGGPSVALINANTAMASFVAPSDAPDPIIDPDLLLNGDFKHTLEPPFTSLYADRQKQLQTWLINLQNARQSGATPLAGLNAMLGIALQAKQLSDLQSLDQQLQAGNDIAPQLVALGLSVSAFNYILQLGMLVKGAQPLLDSEWNELYSILIQVQKVRNFPSWRSKELSAQLSLSPDYFNYPPALPAIFSTGLDSNGDTLSDGTPDPHWAIIATPNGPANPPAPAYVTKDGPPIGTSWMPNTSTSRWLSPQPNENHQPSSGGWIVGVDAPGPYTYRTTIDLTGYDPSSVRLTVNVAVDNDLTAVGLNGRDLGLKASGYTGFATLEINGPFQAGPNVLDFVVNNAGTTPYASGLRVEFSLTGAPLGAALTPWRGTLQAREAWQGTLQGRLGQNGSVIQGLQETQDTTEEAALPFLRDALARACTINTASVVVPVDADWLTERLLIDVQGDIRQKTSRLSQATETMQGLFFTLRNYQFEQLSPQPDVSSWTLTEAGDKFDEEWVWMGTHSSWQSVMLVFLYPENTLLPSLRPAATSQVQNELTMEPADIWEKTQAFDAPPAALPSTALPPAAFVARLESYGLLTSNDAVREANSYLVDLNKTDVSNVSLYPNLPFELKAYPQNRYLDPRTANLLSRLRTNSELSLKNYNSKPDRTKLAYLWEAWYFVPVEIALELQKAGQFEAALDWFRVVYAYDLPLTKSDSGWSDDQRKTFYGLAMENSMSQYIQIPTWMVDSSNPHQIASTRAFPYTRFTILSIVECLLDFADAQFASETDESISNALSVYLNALNLLSQMQEVLPRDPVTDSNPRLASMRQHAETNLFKLHTGRNIAGRLRPAQGTFIQPTVYRYSALMDRAKQLVNLAQQVENSYLAALQKGDDEGYTALRANQDLETANGTVKLQNLKVHEAADGVTLTTQQTARAQLQVNHYNDLFNSDILSLEQTSLDLQSAKAAFTAATNVFEGVASLFGGDVIGALGSFTSAGADVAPALSAQASLEEKQKDWQSQLALAQQDVVIGSQQTVIAQDQQSVASQELVIAATQATHAQATVTFLAKKFTNADLYRWMSGVLGRVYAYFLRQAAAMARLAESQLAFERQEMSLSIIQPDYWQPLSGGNGSAGSSQGPNRAGLTGSDRLLQDITQVDQYAFQTDQRKLQLTKIISLAQMDPFAFQLFQSAGVLRFSTPMDLFDRDFPGQYLRVIKRVRVSVIALIPPTQGIRATLANHGTSRVVVNDEVAGFQIAVVQRGPQLVALTSPANTTGMFDLTDSQPGLLLPFEDLGVDTSWEFAMPRAANPFDYSTIADVLITIDYTALDSPDYRRQVIQELDQSLSADRAYSFRQQFADAWYDLNNSSQSSTPMIVQFQTELQDYPPNVENITIGQLVLYFAPADGASFAVQPTAMLTLGGSDSNGSPRTVQGTATAINGVISTRRGNAGSWVQMIGMQTAGAWTLDLSNPGTSSLFQQGQIQDILFVITYSGQTPAWPA